MGGDGRQPPLVPTAQLAADGGGSAGAGAIGTHAAPGAVVGHLQEPAAPPAAARQPHGELLCKGCTVVTARPGTPRGALLDPDLGVPGTDLSRRPLPRHRARTRAVPNARIPRETPRSRSSQGCTATAAPCQDRSAPSSVPPAPCHSPAPGRQRRRPAAPSLPGRRCSTCHRNRPPRARRSAQNSPPASPAGCLRARKDQPGVAAWGTGTSSPSRDTHLSRRCPSPQGGCLVQGPSLRH